MEKKSILKKTLSVVVTIVFMIVISLIVEILFHKSGTFSTSNNIKNGLSAYELAVENGYEGTLQEWLDTLPGKSAYEIAVENGYSGTEAEWTDALKRLFESDPVGIKTASFNSKGELILSLSDNTEINLGIAVGENGKDGKDGKDGIGLSATAINNQGELVITYTDGKSVNLGKLVGANGQNGKNGKDGKDGVSVVGSEINSIGELVLTYSNGQKDNLGSVIGAKGADGKDGKDGQDGTDGTNGTDGQDGTDGIGITGSAVNDNGELVLTFSDGTTANLGVIVGAKGEKGEDGKNGIDGADGKDGANGIDGQDGKDGISVTNAEITLGGELVLSFSNGQSVNLGNVIGAKGEDGKNGLDGKDGQNGVDGKDGKDGVDGEDGISVVKSEINDKGELVLTYSDGSTDNLGVIIGAKGADGKDGVNGIDGKDGKDGKDGQDGKDGTDGVGIQTLKINAYGQLEITLTSGTTMNLGTVKGSDGKDGRDGIDGANGIDGEDGNGVEKTEINDQGELVITYTDGNAVNLGVVVGKDGADGQDGLNGQDGQDGTNGVDGQDGKDGKDGIGVEKTEINADGQLVITYTDGKSVNLGVVVGKDGKDGQNGMDGQDGKNGTDGKNGADGKDGIGISDVEINDLGELVLTFSDTQTINLGLVAGKDGKDGANGVDGQNGKDGTNGKDGVGIDNVSISDEGILSVTLSSGTTLNLGNVKGSDGIGISKSEINAAGELVFRYTNGSSTNLGKVVGADGKDGVDGVNGQDGKDGVGIAEVTIASDGALHVTLTNDTVLNLGNIKGEQGPAGADGQNGKDGKDGKDGANGVDGKDAYELYKEAHPEYTGSLDEWLESLKGKPGVKGDTGRGIDHTEFDPETGIWTIYYTDSTKEEHDLGSFLGSGGSGGGEKDEYEGILIFSKLPDGTYGVMAGEKAKQVTMINIPSIYKNTAVTQILADAFKDLTILQLVDIPDSITKIGDNAFNGCGNLELSKLPSSLEYIGQYAFQGCKMITNLTIPDTIKFIGGYAFYNTSLTSLTIPYSDRVWQITNIDTIYNGTFRYTWTGVTSGETITVFSGTQQFSRTSLLSDSSAMAKLFSSSISAVFGANYYCYFYTSNWSCE